MFCILRQTKVHLKNTNCQVLEQILTERRKTFQNNQETVRDEKIIEKQKKQRVSTCKPYPSSGQNVGV